MATAGPVLRIDAAINPAMKARPRPIARAFHQPVLDRVVMHVIEMAVEVVDRFQRVLPKSRLPHAATAFLPPTGGDTQSPEKLAEDEVKPKPHMSTRLPTERREVAVVVAGVVIPIEPERMQVASCRFRQS